VFLVVPSFFIASSSLNELLLQLELLGGDSGSFVCPEEEPTLFQFRLCNPSVALIQSPNCPSLRVLFFISSILMLQDFSMCFIFPHRCLGNPLEGFWVQFIRAFIFIFFGHHHHLVAAVRRRQQPPETTCHRRKSARPSRSPPQADARSRAPARPDADSQQHPRATPVRSHDHLLVVDRPRISPVAVRASPARKEYARSIPRMPSRPAPHARCPLTLFQISSPFAKTLRPDLGVPHCMSMGRIQERSASEDSPRPMNRSSCWTTLPLRRGTTCSGASSAIRVAVLCGVKYSALGIEVLTPFNSSRTCLLLAYDLRHNLIPRTLTSDLGSNLSVSVLSICAGLPQILRCLRLGLCLDHNSNGVDGTDLEGTLFKMYTAVSRAYPQNES
ncbi:Unknown protein, partial [Striga hermonthica]